MLLSFLIIIGMETGIAQSLTIHGTVTEKATGEPLPGVGIQVKGTGTGTTTDIKGYYTISAQKGQVLLFSFVGMKTREVKVEGSSPIDIKLEAETRLWTKLLLSDTVSSAKKL